MDKIGKIFLRCFLTTESIRRSDLPCLIIENKGEFLSADKLLNMLCRALTGHNGDSLKFGILIVVICFLFCKVFDHLTIIVQNSLEKIRSPLVRCLVGSNCFAECGRMFESLKNEKNVNEYKDLKTSKWSRDWEMSILCCNKSIIMIL